MKRKKQMYTAKYHRQAVRDSFLKGFKEGRRIGKLELKDLLRKILDLPSERKLNDAIHSHEQAFHKD